MKVHRNNLVWRKRKGIFIIQLSYDSFGLCFQRGEEQSREEGEMAQKIGGRNRSENVGRSREKKMLEVET